MRIKSVTIDGMHNVDHKSYDLTNLTYLHGPNGAGKSTVMQAIQLALLGYIPGTAKTKSELFRHANSHTMAVTLVIDDNGSDVVIRRIWTGTATNVVATVDIRPEGYNVEKIIEELELPIFNFGEFIDMTANKLKDWFINFLPSADTKIDWEIALRENLIVTGVAEIDDDLIKSCASEISSYNLSGIDEVRKANEYFKNALSFKKKEAERLQSTIQSLVFYDDVDESEDESEVRAKIEEYRTKQELRNSQLDSKRRYDLMKKQLDDYSDCTSESYEKDERVIASTKIIEDSEAATLELSESYNNFSELDVEYTRRISEETMAINTINGKISVLQGIIDSKGICPFTSTECGSVKSLIEKYKKDIEAYNSEIKEHSNIIDAMRSKKQDINKSISEINAELKTLSNIISNEHKKIGDIVARYSTFVRLKETIGEAPEVDNDTTDYNALIKEQTDILAKIGANKKYNELIDTLTADKYKIEEEIICYNSWIKLTGVNGLQSDDSAAKPFVDLAEQMDKYIQTVFGESVKSKFNIESKANSFSFGIERNHKYIPFNLLSSGEKCLYTLALMISLVDNSKSPLKIVMVDDLLDHLDNVNVQKLFESLQKVENIQMVYAGVKDVSGDFVVEVG